MSRSGSVVRWVWPWVLVLLLMVGACVDPADDEQGIESEPPDQRSGSSPPEESSPDSEQLPPTLPGSPPGADALLELAGRLAITDGPILVLTDPAGIDRQVLDRVSEGLLSQPTWSPDGVRLAWSRFEDDTATFETVVIEDEERRSVSTGSTPAIYLQWNGDASRIGMLQNRDDGIALSTIALDGNPVPVDAGAPLYFSWAPDNIRLALHIGEQVEVTGGSPVTPLLDTSTAFTAPDWVDQNTLLAATAEALLLLDVGSGLIREVAELDTSTRFVLSPDGSRVAYLGPGDGLRTVQLPGESSALTLRILDLESGDERLVTSDVAIAWEWSPDGKRLAYLGRSEFDRDRLRWYFWEDGQTIGASSEHLPSQVEQQSYLPFFAQYAQSHTRWSPSGNAFAFAGIVGDQAGVFVHVLGETPQSVLVASGDFVTWSPESVAESGGASPL